MSGAVRLFIERRSRVCACSASRRARLGEPFLSATEAVRRTALGDAGVRTQNFTPSCSSRIGERVVLMRP